MWTHHLGDADQRPERRVIAMPHVAAFGLSDGAVGEQTWDSSTGTS